MKGKKGHCVHLCGYGLEQGGLERERKREGKTHSTYKNYLQKLTCTKFGL